MSKKRKRKAGLLAAAACLATALMATPVSAALSDAEKEALAQNIHDYLTATFTMTEENKAELREAGGYYDIVLDELEKTEEDTGALVSVGEVRLEETDTVINCTADVDFEGYDAEVVMTVNASTGYPQNFVVNVDYPLDVRMSEAGMNTVIGLVVVFAILFFLTGVIYLFRYIGRGSGQEKKTEKKQAPPAHPTAAPAAASPAVPAAAGTAGTEEDIELAIVLAAAIAMAEEEEPSGDGYVVRSVRKAGTSRRWKRV